VWTTFVDPQWKGKVLKEQTSLVDYKVSLSVKFFLVVLSWWCIHAGSDGSVKCVYYVLMLVCCSYITYVVGFSLPYGEVSLWLLYMGWDTPEVSHFIHFILLLSKKIK